MPDHRICEVRERDLVALEHLLRDSPDVQMSLKSLELKEVQPPTHLSSGFNPIPAVALVRLLKTLSSKATGLNEIIVNGAKHQNPDLSDSLQLMLNRRRAPQAAIQHTLLDTLITDVGFPSLSRLPITRYELDTDILSCAPQLARFLDRLRSIHVATGYDQTLTGGGGISYSRQITRLSFPVMPTKNNLRDLSLHTIMPIFGPADDLYMCHFPNLQFLSLKGFVAGSGPKSMANFIVTHRSTLKSLELINCPICVSSTWEDDPPTFTPVLYQMAELFDVIRVELQSLRSFHISEDISAPWNWPHFRELEDVNDAYGNLWNAKRLYMTHTVWFAEWIIEDFASAPYRADFERMMQRT